MSPKEINAFEIEVKLREVMSELIEDTERKHNITREKLSDISNELTDFRVEFNTSITNLKKLPVMEKKMNLLYEETIEC